MNAREKWSVTMPSDATYSDCESAFKWCINENCLFYRSARDFVFLCADDAVLFKFKFVGAA